MATIFTNPISPGELNTNLDAHTSQLSANAEDGVKHQHIEVEALTITDTTDERFRVTDFTPQDDYELAMLGLETLDAAVGGASIKLSLKQADGRTEYLLEKDWSVTAQTIVGTTHDRTAYTDVTGDRLTLKKGVPYRLEVENVGTPSLVDRVVGWVLLKSRRRLR